MERHYRSPRHLLGRFLMGKEEGDLVGLPRTTWPSSGRGWWGQTPQTRSGREGEALLEQGVLRFVLSSERLSGNGRLQP